MSKNIFDRLSFLSLLLVVILLPLFCLPFANLSVETSKGLLLVVGLTACIIFWAIARFIDGKIVFPKSKLIGAGFLISLVVFLSALFSSSLNSSLFGTMFDIGSFWFIFTAFIFMFMAAVVFRTPQQARIVLLGSILSSAFVLIFQSVHLFLPNILSLGVLAGKTGNLVGTWNALGIFAGFAGLMFLLVVEFFSISKAEKTLLQIFILLSVLLAATVNFSLVWVLLGISSLIIFVYKVSITLHKNAEEGQDKKNFPLTSFVVMIIAILFFISGPFIGGFIPSRLQISNPEVGPSFGATMSITKGVLSNPKHLLLGIGPNRFAEAWSMYKPAVVNNTQFWDTSFDSGSGLLTTFTATTGILGILAWILFFILFLIVGVKSVFSSIKNGINWEMMAFFILSLYLFISSFFYPTGAVVFLLSLVFTGVFIGLATSNSNSEISMSFFNDHRKSFFSILLLIILVILSIALAFTYIERFVSVSYFGKAADYLERAVNASTEPAAETSLTTSENSINKALVLYSNDLYLRTYSQIYLLDLNSLASKGTALSSADQASMQNIFSAVIKSAQYAIGYDSQNYLNFQLLGSVYQTVGGLGVKDVYDQAIKYYQTASSLNPLNPGLKLSIASAYFANGNVPDAINYANQALALKPDYVDAFLTLSKIEQSQGNNSQALSYAQAALAITPTDQNIIQYVNSLSGSSSTPSSATGSTSDSTTTTSTNKAKK